VFCPALSDFWHILFGEKQRLGEIGMPLSPHPMLILRGCVTRAFSPRGQRPKEQVKKEAAPGFWMITRRTAEKSRVIRSALKFERGLDFSLPASFVFQLGAGRLKNRE